MIGARKGSGVRVALAWRGGGTIKPIPSRGEGLLFYVGSLFSSRGGHFLRVEGLFFPYEERHFWACPPPLTNYLGEPLVTCHIF